MQRKFFAFILVVASLALALSVSAQEPEPIKIGFISTLSGPASALGVDALDGFNLAIQHLGGEMGGRPVEVIVRDDTQNPDVALQAAVELLEAENVDFMTGIIFSNIMLAVGTPVFESETFYISLNAGPSQYAGAGCNPFFFNVAWQNDNLHEAMGKYVNDQGFNNVFILAPDYPAGRDALTGFKRFYTGNLADEIYTAVNQLDFAVEIELIRAAAPDAVFTFQPGGSGINFIKQYSEAGLLAEIPLFLPGFSADQDVIRAVGAPMAGLFNSSHWALELDNEANVRFTSGFALEFERTPTIYAQQGYDAAMLIASAVEAVGGDLSDKAAVGAALQAADFESTRGDFAFNNNHYPIQDYYLRQVIMNQSGDLYNQLVGVIFEDHQDAYHEQCAME
jgi:branched-chain amino acid transport system substrate-binding protein